MSTSNLQRYTKNRLMMIPQCNELQENIRPDWLISPNGERLELDFFIPSLNLALEVQGKQHFEFVEFFHRDNHGYNAQIYRDKTKKAICEKAGIKLLEVYQEDDVDNIVTSLCYPDVLPTDYITTPPSELTKDGKPRLNLQEILQLEKDKEKRLREIRQRKKEARKRLRENVQAKRIELRSNRRQEAEEADATAEIRQKEFIANRMKMAGGIENIGKNRRAFNRKMRQLNNKIDNNSFLAFMNEVGIPESYFNNVLRTG